MPQCDILLSAEADLDQIWAFIARDNPQNADRFLDSIQDFCNDTLAYQPMMGRNRAEIEPDLRSFPFQGYTIFSPPLTNKINDNSMPRLIEPVQLIVTINSSVGIEVGMKFVFLNEPGRLPEDGP